MKTLPLNLNPRPRRLNLSIPSSSLSSLLLWLPLSTSPDLETSLCWTALCASTSPTFPSLARCVHFFGSRPWWPPPTAGPPSRLLGVPAFGVVPPIGRRLLPLVLSARWSPTRPFFWREAGSTLWCRRLGFSAWWWLQQCSRLLLFGGLWWWVLRSVAGPWVRPHPISSRLVYSSKELHRRRLQIKSKFKSKKKPKGNKEFEEKDLKAKGFEDQVADLFSEGSNVNERDDAKDDVPLVFKKRKLHWGLDTKERWERKSNM